MQVQNRLLISFKKTILAFVNMLPIIVGMLLLTSLIITLFPEQISTSIFGNGDTLDTLLGATIGSLAVGHPLASYLLGGELLGGGISLIAVTALLITWVTVGVAQLPAESLMLGVRFALYRNAICFFAAIIIAFLTVFTLRFIEMI
ncbi:hypothetical protein BOV90_00400 [Solemya velum gill symbiont]|uniref:Permease n=1 Tax=Solemya velum gill symbiont TaxID=2340 RepID=A0A0B0H2H5_SOVGS|nr:hypothetical protein [Solemya velum gill symbiont]KHF24378.1 hypothetical protein JV46_27790 [Solemya velum gill symbiont]OOY35185.1 hypothetical protein BOV88_06650 [Solemya velum gill symbiont]OOY37799.1 hypothetical protein BOV89_05060 [Solemya velum gill symbiont]OOY41094.1 hypothetical protein BOV90_00400 [Solemya velum gill symbiont]OOY43143.1 hypothetical protein BOV92_12005 [Solemya velum gill symbiont]